MRIDVTLKIDGRVTFAVDAQSFHDAAKKAEEMFQFASIEIEGAEEIDIVGFAPVNATDENGEMIDF